MLIALGELRASDAVPPYLLGQARLVRIGKPQLLKKKRLIGEHKDPFDAEGFPFHSFRIGARTLRRLLTLSGRVAVFCPPMNAVAPADFPLHCVLSSPPSFYRTDIFHHLLKKSYAVKKTL